MTVAATPATAVHVRITGRVQGVGYRAWTEGMAAELGLAGWVRNRRDGTVEAVFSGTADAIDEMLRCCARGPAGAAVSTVAVLGEAVGPFEGFETKPTV